MYFSLIDRIESLEPGKSIVATKSLSMAEEYLRDHFPNFPVMPGVLMLEAMTQSAAWLIRVSEDFKHSIVILQESQNVRFGRFMQPGQTLSLSLQQIREDEKTTTFQAKGLIGDQTSLRAQLTLARYNLRDHNPAMARTDEDVIAALKQQLCLLWKET